VIEVYAIADHPGPPLPEVGELRVVPVGRLAAICAEVEEGELTPAALWRHEEIVEALMEGRDLLPVRYSTRLADEGQVARAVAERHDALLQALRRVRGATELALRVAAPPEAPAPPEAARRVHDRLAAEARASTLLDTGDSADLLRAAYLVERGAGEAFTAEVAALQDATPQLRLLCTGPWPPYSFAEA
jgi:hypothetical protein